jgi:hypothetical protein
MERGNSIRVWLNDTAYERNPADFLKSIQNYPKLYSYFASNRDLNHAHIVEW